MYQKCIKKGRNISYELGQKEDLLLYKKIKYSRIKAVSLA